MKTYLDGQHGAPWNMAVATKTYHTTTQGVSGIPVNVVSTAQGNQHMMADLVELFVITFNWSYIQTPRPNIGTLIFTKIEAPKTLWNCSNEIL